MKKLGGEFKKTFGVSIRVYALLCVISGTIGCLIGWTIVHLDDACDLVCGIIDTAKAAFKKLTTPKYIELYKDDHEDWDE